VTVLELRPPPASLLFPRQRAVVSTPELVGPFCRLARSAPTRRAQALRRALQGPAANCHLRGPRRSRSI